MTSKKTGDAASNNRSLISEIEFIGKCLARLSERFDIEKENARQEGSIEHLEKFLERSRVFFQPEVGTILASLFRVRSRIGEGEGAGEAEKSSVDMEKQIRKAATHFVSTPHRLIRTFDAVQGSEQGT